MKYQILGDNMQALSIELARGEGIWSEAGAMMYIRGPIDMDSETRGGVFAGLKRAFLMGESFFTTTFTCQGDWGNVGFASPYPGKIIPIDVMPGRVFVMQRDAFVAATPEVHLEMAFTKRLGAGFFGGEGFILQKIEGQGTAWLHAGGNTVNFELQPGEQLTVDTGCLVGFDETVDYNVRLAGNIKTMFFGGEGLFVTDLKGPGTVVLQTLPFSRLADRIEAAMGSGAKGQGGPADSLGDSLGGGIGRIFGGD